MSKNLTDLNAEPLPDDGSGLRGGTQAGDPDAVPAHLLTGTPGGTTALNPTGGSHQGGRGHEAPSPAKAAGDRENPEDALSGGRTKPSPDVAAQRARDAVHVPGTHSGIDEGNPKQVPDDHPEDVV